MAHYAKVENGTVVDVVVVSDDYEDTGNEYLNSIGFQGSWLKTSYNTYGGSHPSGTPLRYNYAGVGFSYDPAKDAFIPPKPFASWELNEETCLWDPPVPMPQDGGRYVWDEESLSWVDFVAGPGYEVE